MRLMLLWPSAEMSTHDVAVGVRAGLVGQGHEVVDYRLARRWKLLYAGFQAWSPDNAPPSMDMVAKYASEPLVHNAMLSGVPWVLVVSGMGVHPDALLACRMAGIRVACWFTEAPYNTDDERELYLARLCDVAFVNERTCVADFQRAMDQAGNGGIAAYLPHGFDPVRHRPMGPDDAPLTEDERTDVVLVGTGFAERVWLLESIDWSGINLRLTGIWPGVRAPSHLHQHVRDGAINNAETVRLYWGTRIVLNPHRYAESAESANPRVYEAAACGAFQISDERAETAELFRVSIPRYDPQVPWQLSAMIRRYLADEPERRRLAEQARERVQGQTFDARASTIVETLETFERQQRRGRLVAVPA